MPESTIQPDQFKRESLAVLIQAGLSMVEAERLSVRLTEHYFRLHRGNRTYWSKGYRGTGLGEDVRRRIFVEWWTDRQEQSLCQAHEISITTLRTIQAEGRKKGWEPR